MGKNDFFSIISRMKYIDRWALMRNTCPDSLDSHSKEVAVLAHALALLGNKRLGKNYNADRSAVLALYHDAHEILTGDMPTPVKYHNPAILTAFKDIENAANERLSALLPDDLKGDYLALLTGQNDEELLPLIKAADKLSALIKCIEERKAGNTEFLSAEQSLRELIAKLGCEEADIFQREFIPSYELTLDEMTGL